VLLVDENRETPRSFKHNKRWININALNTMDLAYLYVENEEAIKENIPVLEIGVDTKHCIV